MQEDCKMLRLTISFYVLIVNYCVVNCEDTVFNEMEMIPSADLNQPDDPNQDVASLIEKFQSIGTSAHKLNREGVAPLDDVEKLYDDMIEVLDSLTEVVRNPQNAYKFLKAKGIDKIATSNLKIDYDELKTRLLILLKVLFNIAPTTTSAVIPITVVDRLLDIFEYDNLALKAHAVDVLYVWLPDNPKVQARVMKLKGLEPFYAQMSKLDTNVVKMLLDLLNKILVEHLKVRNEVQRTTVDAEKLKSYQRIGLLEHLSTKTVCYGLLNIFSWSWTYNSKDYNILATTFELLKNVKQFCLKKYQGQAKALKLFMALQEFVQNPENKVTFEGTDMTEVALALDDYVDNLKHTVKDEF